MTEVAEGFGLRTRFVLSDGNQPVGRGIGPALEAWDVLRVLQRHPEAPADLRARAITLAGAALELAGRTANGQGENAARKALDDGSAWSKFQAICKAQGGLRVPPVAGHSAPVIPGHAGMLTRIDNRKLARLAKLAGAPGHTAAGIDLHKRLGDWLDRDEPVATIHAEAPGELAYAMEYALSHTDMFTIESSPE